MKEQQNQLMVLENNGIPVVVLKGASAATNYPTPKYHCIGDIDIIVCPADFEGDSHDWGGQF